MTGLETQIGLLLIGALIGTLVGMLWPFAQDLYLIIWWRIYKLRHHPKKRGEI